MKKYKKIILLLLVMVLLSLMFVTVINVHVVTSQQEKILTRQEAIESEDIDYVVVLGCGIKNNRPTHMLEDRLLEGIAIASKNENCLLMLTGDNSGEHYNEVAVMKNFCIEKGFDVDRIVTDDYGFSTGESMENMRNFYSADKIIIISQTFHVYRALYIAESLGIEAYAVTSSPREYSTWLYNNIREPLARIKDFIKYGILN